MNPIYGSEAEAYRDKIQAFLAEKLPADWGGIGRLEGDALHEFVEWWRGVLYDAGYLAPGWPVEYGGGGLTALEQVIIDEEFARAGVPTGGSNDVFGIQMLGNTLLRWGTEEQKPRYLPRDPVRGGPLVPGVLRAQRRLRPRQRRPARRARRRRVGAQRAEDLDSAGHLADWIFTLARTEPDAPKHKGISFLLVDMRQPGIEVRPIRMISGQRVQRGLLHRRHMPADKVVGGVNNGWAVAMTLLGFERGWRDDADPLPGRVDRLLMLARERGVTTTR